MKNDKYYLVKYRNSRMIKSVDITENIDDMIDLDCATWWLEGVEPDSEQDESLRRISKKAIEITGD